MCTNTILLILSFLLCVTPGFLQEFQKTENDTILEIFNNCICVPYYNCDKNNFIITDGENLFDVRDDDNFKNRIPCSNFTYTCCKNRSESVTPRSPTYNQFFTNENKTKLHCGEQRTITDVRIKSPDLDFASTIKGEFPWIFSIFQQESGTNNYKYKSTGSLIHPKVILTVTHSVRSAKADKLKVLASGNTLTESSGSVEDSERTVIKIITHPEYYSGGLYNDAALLILNRPYNLKKLLINTICLPEKNDNFEGKRCLAAGWGKEKPESERVLRKVELPIINFEKCQNLMRNTSLGSNFNLDTSFLCAGGEAGRDTCVGDGGAPLMCLNENDHYIQAGIVSWGIGCGEKRVPGIYTNVAQMREWIDQQLQENIE